MPSLLSMNCTLRRRQEGWESLPVPLLTRSATFARWCLGRGEKHIEMIRGAVRAAIFSGPGKVEVGERPDPRIEHPTDAVVRVVMGCVCGSDLWYYRGESEHAIGSIGHEFIGVVEAVGFEVSTVAVGDLVVAPFIFSDMSCPTACTARRSPALPAADPADKHLLDAVAIEHLDDPRRVERWRLRVDRTASAAAANAWSATARPRPARSA
jgi:hypothetical protein